MAIFTREDLERVPLLSQFYQLVFDPEALIDSELHDWVEIKDEYWRALRWPTRSTEGSRRRDTLAHLRPLAELHPVVRGVFRGLECDGAILREAAEGYLDFLNYTRAERAGTLPGGQAAFSPLDLALLVRSQAETNPLLVFLVDGLRHLVTSASYHGSEVLRLCPECLSVFEAAGARGDRRYCSQRCRIRRSARNAGRRKRAGDVSR